MNFGFFLALLLTITPFIELRGGLPLAIIYSNSVGIPIIFSFLLVVLLNILIIFLIFLFLDYIHNFLLRFNFYSIFFEKYLIKTQKKVEKFERHYKRFGFWAMIIFVGIPLPGTGVYSACLIAWLLDLDRRKMIPAISIGVVIAGIIIFLGTLGVLRLV
jgi:uncharacterized membrane protein